MHGWIVKYILINRKLHWRDGNSRVKSESDGNNFLYFYIFLRFYRFCLLMKESKKVINIGVSELDRGPIGPLHKPWSDY